MFLTAPGRMSDGVANGALRRSLISALFAILSSLWMRAGLQPEHFTPEGIGCREADLRRRDCRTAPRISAQHPPRRTVPLQMPETAARREARDGLPRKTAAHLSGG